MVDLSDFTDKLPGGKCSVPGILAKLTEEQREKVDAALIEPSIKTTSIQRKVVEWSGANVSAVTMGRHRNHQCRCD